MFAILTTVLFVAGLGLLVFLGAKVGVGSTDWVHGLFIFPTTPPRPRGMQEDDLPPLVFPDLDAKAA